MNKSILREIISVQELKFKKLWKCYFMQYVVNIEKEESEVSGIKIVWKDSNNDIVEKCIITTEEKLDDIETALENIQLDASSILRPEVILQILRENGGAGSGLDCDTLRGYTPNDFVTVDFLRTLFSQFKITYYPQNTGNHSAGDLVLSVPEI